MEIKDINLDDIDDDILLDRKMSGFLLKKNSNKTDILASKKRRWFIIISNKNPLDEEDDEIMDKTLLPPWMDTDTLYYFTDSDDKDEKPFNKKLGEIKI